MTANVEQFGEMAAFASLRKPAWWDLEGAYTVDQPLPLKQFAEKAHLLGWDVRKVLAADLVGDTLNFKSNIYFNVRDNPFGNGVDVLGIVRERYENFQPEEMIETAEGMSSGQLRAETMGSLNGGGTVFMSFVHPDDIVLDPNGSNDAIRRYVSLIKSFDGTSPLTGMQHNTRVECQNTLNIAVRESKPFIKIRHTATMRDRLTAGLKIAGWTDEYDAEFEAQAQQLFAAKFTDKKFWDLVTGIFEKPENDVKGAVKKWENKTERVVSVWNDGTGSMKNLPKNGWRAFNALTEENQWNRQIRNGNVNNALEAGFGLEPRTNEFRQETLGRVLEAIGA